MEVLMRWILLLVLVFPSLGLAQVNIEKLRSNGTEDGLSGHLGFSAAFTSGNIQFADFGSNAHQEYKTGAHSIFWVMGIRFAAKRTQADLLAEPSVGLWDEEAHFSNLMLQHLRYNYALTQAIWVEVFTQYEYNEFLLLDRRLIAGVGPRIALARGDKGAAFFGASAMMEEERLNPDSIADSEEIERIDWRASTYLSATYSPTDDLSWTTTFYFQPRIDALSDYRLVAETGLSFKLSKHVAFTADAKLRYDTAPPATPEGFASVLGTDISVKNGIKLNW